MKWQSKGKGLLLVLAAALVIPLAVPTSALAAKSFTAAISPTSAYSDASTEYTLTITCMGTGGTKIGSAKVTVPAGFTVSSIGTPTASSSKTWTASLDSGVITLTASGGTNKIAYGEFVRITITAERDRTYSVSVDPATATVVQGDSTTADVSVGVDPEGDLTAEWTTIASSATPWESADWTLSGSQPSVTVNVPTVTLSASGQPAGVTVTFDPESGTPPFGSTMTIDVGSTVAPGTYYITISVTYGDSELATTTFTLIVEAPAAYEGLSHGDWKNHTEYWPATGYSPSQTLASVFTESSTFGLGSYTLLQALDFAGGDTLAEKAQILLRNAVAAVLNAAHPGINYPLTVAQVITQVNAALASGDADTMLELEATLDVYNNLGGSI